jgi:hypothetical protein
MSTKVELNSVKKLVLHVLEHYPETRNNDTKLYLQCAKLKGAQTLDDLERIDLSIVSVHKVRQPIQNKLGLFKPNKKTKEKREQLEMEFKEYMVSL